jgi:hypothetical protein
MRTRFLATDYFSPSPAAASSPDQALSLAALRFPPLPAPSLPPDPQFRFPIPFPAVADLPAASISGDDLDSLPVSSALSAFLAAVIPQVRPAPTIPAPADDDEVSPLFYGNPAAFSTRVDLFGVARIGAAFRLIFQFSI